MSTREIEYPYVKSLFLRPFSWKPGKIQSHLCPGYVLALWMAMQGLEEMGGNVYKQAGPFLAH
jgi:hypothetical protein